MKPIKLSWTTATLMSTHLMKRVSKKRPLLQPSGGMINLAVAKIFSALLMA